MSESDNKQAIVDSKQDAVDKKADEAQKPKISYFKLYRHASSTDLTLIGFGTIFAIANGVSLVRVILDELPFF